MRAARAGLREPPDDLSLLTTFVGNCRSAGGKPPPDTLELLLHARRRAGEETGPIVRDLILARFEDDETTGAEAMDIAFSPSATPSERDIHAFFHRLGRLLPADAPKYVELADRAREAWSDSPTSLYYSAKARFDADDPAAAVALVDARRSHAGRVDYLAELYMRSLDTLGRQKELTAFIDRFFAGYEGNLWREKGFSEKQEDAIRRGVPPMRFITQAKSGTVFTVSTLRAGLRAPRTAIAPRQLSPGIEKVIPSMATDFAKGGAICAQHFLARPAVLDALRGVGIARFVLNFHDVRQSALSWTHHEVSDEIQSIPRPRLLERMQGRRRQDRFEEAYLSRIGPSMRLFCRPLVSIQTMSPSRSQGRQIRPTIPDASPIPQTPRLPARASLPVVAVWQSRFAAHRAVPSGASRSEYL